MPTLFNKLNLKSQKEILVLNAPDSFENELTALKDISVVRDRVKTFEFNRDNGWDELRKLGFDTVRAVAIDEDWSALRFRRVELIKSGK